MKRGEHVGGYAIPRSNLHSFKQVPGKKHEAADSQGHKIALGHMRDRYTGVMKDHGDHGYHDRDSGKLRQASGVASHLTTSSRCERRNPKQCLKIGRWVAAITAGQLIS
jgi:hypothetical protein